MTPPAAHAGSPPADPRPLIEAWTDGGCRPNPGPGGWGVVLRWNDHVKELSGGEPDTTNNRMELAAAIAALEAPKRPARLIIHTDSEYLRNGITRWIAAWQRNGWRTAGRAPVANRDLWQRLVEAARRHEVEWRWVRGHAGDPMNERADRLAAAARERFGG